MPKFTNISVLELSVFRGVSGCLWYNVIKVGHMQIAFFSLLKIPHVSAYAAEDATLRVFSLCVDRTVFLGYISSALVVANLSGRNVQHNNLLPL